LILLGDILTAVMVPGVLLNANVPFPSQALPSAVPDAKRTLKLAFDPSARLKPVRVNVPPTAAALGISAYTFGVPADTKLLNSTPGNANTLVGEENQ